jgi:hypothetical protein
MLITAAKTAHYTKLADDLDAALARGDDIGFDLLRAMLPELGAAIEEINDALRDVDALLLEGLRDEAIGLHDAGLSAVALRLHLPDKPAWPMVSLSLDSEGIKPPPAIDFAALTAINSAYVEIDSLRKPLDKLRRLALERAPIARRISVLRRLRAHDAAKPVWADQLSAHEELRLMELDTAVRKALAARDADALAALHDELASEEWSIPISSKLRHATQGGLAWAGLRSMLQDLDVIASQIAAEHGAVLAAKQDDDQFDDRVERLQALRQRWLTGESQGRELLFALPQHTALMPLTRDEDFGPRLDGLRRQVGPALDWLAELDRRAAIGGQFEQVCGDLDLLTRKLPDRKTEAEWLDRIELLDREMRRLCQQHSDLHAPAALPPQIDQAVAQVRARAARRGRRRLIAAALALACFVAVLATATSFIANWRDLSDALAYLAELKPPAKQGEYVGRPERLEAYASRHGKNVAFAAAIDEFDKFAALERTRRETFDDLVAGHEAKLKDAADALADRAEAVESRLAEWPAAVFEAAERYRSARLKGGFPNRRFIDDEAAPPRSTGEAAFPPAARQRFGDEETRLAAQADKQSRLERSYAAAAIEEFQRQLKLLEDAAPAAEEPGAAESAKALLGKLDTLLDEGRKPRSGEYAPNKRRLLFPTLDTATPLRKRLERMSTSR